MRILRAGVLLCFALALTAACSEDGLFEQAGQKADEAVDDAVDDAADSVGDAVNEATEDLDD